MVLIHVSNKYDSVMTVKLVLKLVGYNNDLSSGADQCLQLDTFDTQDEYREGVFSTIFMHIADVALHYTKISIDGIHYKYHM